MSVAQAPSDSMSAPSSESAKAESEELSELQVLLTLGTSLKALHEMMKAIKGDLTVMSENVKRVNDMNKRWKVVVGTQKALREHQPQQ